MGYQRGLERYYIKPEQQFMPRPLNVVAKVGMEYFWENRSVRYKNSWAKNAKDHMEMLFMVSKSLVTYELKYSTECLKTSDTLFATTNTLVFNSDTRNGWSNVGDYEIEFYRNQYTKSHKLKLVKWNLPHKK